MQKAKHQSGFTIVELLIVIVVIAILAAISIVAYTGIQTRANDSSVLSDIRTYTQTAQMYYVENGEYPTTLTGWALNDAASPATSANNAYKVYYKESDPNAGFVIVGSNRSSGNAWAYSSWSGGSPIPVSGTRWQDGIVSRWTSSTELYDIEELGLHGITFDDTNGVRWGLSHSVGL